MKKTAQVLCFNRYGIPEEVIQTESWPIDPLKPGDVWVESLFSPINPADLNTIEGRYQIRPQLPAVGGSEGVGVVSAVGSAVKDLELGATVIAPRRRGTWCSSYVA